MKQNQLLKLSMSKKLKNSELYSSEYNTLNIIMDRILIKDTIIAYTNFELSSKESERLKIELKEFLLETLTEHNVYYYTSSNRNLSSTEITHKDPDKCKMLLTRDTGTEVTSTEFQDLELFKSITGVLTKIMTIKIKRNVYLIDDITIHLDTVEDLGHFLEIRTKSGDEHLLKLNTISKQLGVLECKQFTKTYRELFRYKNSIEYYIDHIHKLVWETDENYSDDSFNIIKGPSSLPCVLAYRYNMTDRFEILEMDEFTVFDQHKLEILNKTKLDVYVEEITVLVILDNKSLYDLEKCIVVPFSKLKRGRRPHKEHLKRFNEHLHAKSS